MPSRAQLSTRRHDFSFDGREVTVVSRSFGRRRPPVRSLFTEVSLWVQERDFDGHPYRRFHLTCPSGDFTCRINHDQAIEGRVFARSIAEARCERLRWIFRRTIGLGPHRQEDLERTIREFGEFGGQASGLALDVGHRLGALRREGVERTRFWEIRGLTRETVRPVDQLTDTGVVLGAQVQTYFNERFRRFVDLLRGDYEPLEDPAWQTVVDQYRAGG
ncbi:hypothetical protein EAO71_22905 [Streptomyces sp. ms191]|uniref:hypothetical protein n=1 Tax=unclassified Streptomyces TaxID=2593676 RepID=UPI0011CDB959|nr:hypothetical protein [Streptomyces sp. ms191]TXS22906.1 hypothetical protein EAO71_22905 [Streptomyces sp. ms191]